jgi:hypothetical protein
LSESGRRRLGGESRASPGTNETIASDSHFETAPAAALAPPHVATARRTG